MHSVRLFTLALCVVAVQACGASDDGRPPTLLHSRYGAIDPLTQGLPELSGLSTVPTDAGFYLVQFRDRIQPSWRNDMVARGAKIRGYMPVNALVVSASAHTAAVLEGLPYVRAVRTQPALWRVDPSLVTADAAGLRLTDDGGPRDVLIELAEARAWTDVAAFVRATHGQVVRGTGKTVRGKFLRARLSADALHSLLTFDQVVAVQPYAPVQLHNDIAYGIIQSGSVHARSVWDHGLRGQNQIVGVCDVGVFQGSCFFGGNKIAAYETINAVVPHDLGHGSHTAGSIAGDNFGNGTYDTNDGMAPAARLFVQDAGDAAPDSLSVPDDLGILLQSAYDGGARIHSDSWGGIGNVYGLRERSLDAFVALHPDLLVIVANGNSSGASGSVGSPAAAKNVISVGALRGAAPEDVAAFSSHGPTVDGRIKPTLCAPGQQVVSASSTEVCGTTVKSGTSMAAPLVAGAAALVRQYFTEGFYPSGRANPADALQPSAALLKAVLLAGADQMVGENTDGLIPSNGQGFGRVHLDNALSFPGSAQQLWVNDANGLDQDGQETFVLNLAEGGALKVALTWMDAPANLLAARALVNDLDLQVVAPTGEIYLGNATRGGQSVAGGAPDNVNVEEIFFLPNAPAGQYTVTVRASNVVFGPQPFAVAAAGRIMSNGMSSVDLGTPTTKTYEESSASATASTPAGTHATPCASGAVDQSGQCVVPMRRGGCLAIDAPLGGFLGLTALVWFLRRRAQAR